MSDESSLSRRHVLRVVWAGGGVALAGCLGGGGDDGGNDDGGTGGDDCEDLSLDLSTGTTDGTPDAFGTTDTEWQVTGSPDFTTGQAVSIEPVSQWATVPTANWIDPYGTGGWPAPSDPLGNYVYEVDFEVPDTWGDDQCELRISQWAVDDDATFELDGPSGTTTLAQGSGHQTLKGPVSQPVGPGQYTLRVLVSNNQTITGLLVDAELVCRCEEEPVDGECDLSIRKEQVGDAAPVSPGDTVEFEITVCNDGDGECADPVTVVDDLPAGTTHAADSGSGWDCSESGGVLTCEHPNADGLGPGECLPPLTVAVDVGGSDEIKETIVNCATVEQGDADAGNKTDCVEVPVNVEAGECDLSVSKRHDGDVVTAGENTTFELTVCNDGDERCRGPVSVIDSLPSGVTYVSGGGTGWTTTVTGGVVTFEHPNSGGVAPGDCLPAITLDVEVGSIDETGDQLINCASIKYEDADPENNRDCVSLPVRPPEGGCDLSITKRHEGDVVTAGGTTEFEITVCNDGETDCEESVTVLDTLPSGVTYLGGSGTGWNCTESGGVVTCTHGNGSGLAPGDCLPPLTLDVEVGSIDETGDRIINCASLDGGDPDLNRDCVAVGVVEEPDGGCEGLNIEKSVGRRFHYGGQGTYEIEVCNYREETCNGVVEVTDTLAPGLTFVSASGSGWNVSASGGTVTAVHANSNGLTGGQCLPLLTLTVAVDSVSDFPGGSDGVQNCAQVSTGGPVIDEDCITHVITNQ